MNDKIDLDHFRALLIARRDELNALSGASEDARKPVELDQQSTGRLTRLDAIQQQQMAKAQETRRAGELKKIEAALARITEDEFGYCGECGEAIAVKRLEIDPTTQICVGCASTR
ncbi:MAG: TraR/DksA family transcriptional regulator [Marinicaulis sp.]|nr:TraR/DksA family transcriptional regulator [Marinicaulis sp.]NNE39781.1 TraR/DksA family transcriptional regulator [Marinicaulis sp.]NNL88812.1 TraR/DksA family transcriptional regulator [Marinicaulis sp.]